MKRYKEVSEECMAKMSERIYMTDTEGTERIAYVKDNVEAMEYRLRMAEAAEKKLILSTFDFNADEAGKDLMSALQRAAKRGVYDPPNPSSFIKNVPGY